MDNPALDALDAECRILCDYLASREPGPYVLEKYRRAHALGHPVAGRPADQTDRWLLRLAQKGRTGAAAADAYASAFARTSLIRRKLVLLMAILECTESGDTLDVADRGSRIGFFAATAIKAIGFGARAVGIAVAIRLLRLMGVIADDGREAS